MKRILFVGDIVGSPGRKAVAQAIPELRREHRLDLVIGNVENAAGGFGITPAIAEELFQYLDVMTSGNHIWDKKEIYEYIAKEPRLLRPANFPPGNPGKGVCVHQEVVVVNLIGRVFMPPYDCPFQEADRILKELGEMVSAIVVDMHAEATSEKQAMGCHLDGRVSAVVGTHTHVPTDDLSVSGNGTAYVTDVGMTGPVDSIIGMRKEEILRKFLTQMPARFEVGSGTAVLNSVLLEIDESSGKAVEITRLRKRI